VPDSFHEQPISKTAEKGEMLSPGGVHANKENTDEWRLGKLRQQINYLQLRDFRCFPRELKALLVSGCMPP
jgi:hypothetical protein